ncbi:hypothetical protein PMAYCL1PPCAC_19656, partial [Pristionchus mayeri]
FQTYYFIIALLTWHPIVLYLLFRQSGAMSKRIRWGYIANQVTLILYEWVICWMIRIYPLMPYPGLHCGGVLCGRGIHPQILLTIIAVGVILINPPFEYLLLVMHQTLVDSTNSPARLSNRTQNVMKFVFFLLLLLNMIGFGIFGVRTAKADEILRRPELAWIKDKGGEVFLFGDVGDPEKFAFECYMLASVIVVVFPFVMFLSIHSIYIIALTKKGFTDHSTRLQVRLTSVLLTQLICVFKTYALPLGIMSTIIMFGAMGMPDWLIGIGRPMLMV